MACSCREDCSASKIRECNSVIRNRNHILKCTLKTLIDNPSRTRDKALNSLIGLCRKQCNGPMKVQTPPKKFVSMPIVLPIHYTPVCPPPLVVKVKKGQDINEAVKAEEKKRRSIHYRQSLDANGNPRKSSISKKKRNKPIAKPTNKQANDYDSKNCGCPKPTSNSAREYSQNLYGFSANYGKPQSVPRPTSSPRSAGFQRQEPDRCSRRCCLPKTQTTKSAPMTMSPLCCPPPVKSLCSKGANKSKGPPTPIVRSYRCNPPPVGRKKEQQNQGFRFNSPPRQHNAAPSRPYSAPGSNHRTASDICKNNTGYDRYLTNSCWSNNDGEVGYDKYLTNSCWSNNDSEVDPAIPARSTQGPSTQGSSSQRTEGLFSPASESVNPQILASQRYADKMRGTVQAETFFNFKSSEYPGPALRSARDDPLSITTWKTSKPIRFSDLHQGKRK